MRQSVQRFDQQVTQAVVSFFGKSARSFFELMTMLGDPIAVSIVTMAIIVTGLYQSNTPVVMSGLVIPATVIIGALLKLLFERARPMTEYAMNMKLQTFSFPSGHSSGSMITFGTLAYFVFELVPGLGGVMLTCALATIPILVGISRVYLGAHFPSDVLAGWALGIVALIIVIYIISPVA